MNIRRCEKEGKKEEKKNKEWSLILLLYFVVGKTKLKNLGVFHPSYSLTFDFFSSTQADEKDENQNERR